MKNTVISEEERTKVLEICKQVEELIEIHSNQLPNLSGDTTSVEQIHSVVYLDVVGKLINSAKLLSEIFTMSEEEFVNTVTHDGEKSIEEVLSLTMLKCLKDILK